MRKIAAILILLILMVSISSLVLADDEEDQDEQDFGDEPQEQENETQEPEDNETEEEIEIMNNSLGAEIRLLQLEKALLKNILKGNMAVEIIKGLGYNTSELEDILDDMEALLEEVKTANTTSNESVQIFVELKREAKNYTRQFRETVKELLDDVKINEIRATIREMVNGELQNYSKRIQNRIRHFNRNQLYRLYGIIGETNNSFINEYMNGNITLNQTKLQICKMINQMTKEKKYDVFSEIKEENIKGKIHAKYSAENGHGKGKGNGRNK